MNKDVIVRKYRKKITQATKKAIKVVVDNEKEKSMAGKKRSADR